MPSDDDQRERLTGWRTDSTEPPDSIEEIAGARAHPDPRTDLGYEAIEWEQFSAADDSDQLVFLPAEEEMLLQDAFVIVAESLPELIVAESDLQDLDAIR